MFNIRTGIFTALLVLCAATAALSQPEVQAIYARGQEHFKAMRWDDAIREYTEVIRLRSDVAGVYYSRGLCYLNKRVGEPKKTYMQEAQIAGNLKPGEKPPKSQNSLNAIADFSKAIDLQPGAPSYGIYYARAQVYKLEKDLEPAILDLQKFIEVYPAYEQHPQFSTAKVQLTEIGNDYAQSLVTRGLYEIVMLSYSTVRGDKRTAEEIRQDDERDREIKDLFRKAVKYYQPVDSYSYAGRARARLQLDDFAGAVGDFKEAVKLKPTDASLIADLANAYKRDNQFDPAIAEYSKIIALPEAHPSVKIAKNNAYYRRGELYFEQNKVDLALADVNKAIADSPKNFVAYFLRGRVYAKKGNKTLARADFVKSMEASGLRKVAQVHLDMLDGKAQPKSEPAKAAQPTAKPATPQVVTPAQPAVSVTNTAEPSVAFVVKPAPEPLESKFRKEMEFALTQQNPSWYRGVAFLNLAAGLQKTGKPEKEVGELLGNKLLEIAYIDFYVVYEYILMNKNYNPPWSLTEKLLGGLTPEMRKKLRETSSLTVKNYLAKKPPIKISEIFKPGYGWGKTVSSNPAAPLASTSNNNNAAAAKSAADESRKKLAALHVASGLVEKDPKAALVHFRKALEVDPTYQPAKDAMAKIAADELLAKGDAFATAKDFRSALAEYNKAVETAPNYINTYWKRARLLAKAALQDPNAVNNELLKSSLADFDKVLTMNSKFPDGYFLRGVMLFQLDRLEPAIADLTKAISLNPNKAEYYDTRADVYRVLGDDAKKMADIRKSNELKGVN
ncbi:MAG: tetratricopeptide repeat protein [Pyrinomonadaceae bacterium]